VVKWLKGDGESPFPPPPINATLKIYGGVLADTLTPPTRNISDHPTPKHILCVMIRA